MGIQYMVNEVVDSETAMLKRRIQNLENALRDSQELLLDITRADMYEISELLQKVDDQTSENESVLEGEYED
jgi:prefoldin subunit 5